MRNERYLGLLLISLVAAVAVAVHSRIMEQDYPRIRVAIGQNISQVQARSTYPFSLKGQEDDSSFVIEQPVLLEYEHGAASITPPPGAFLWLSQLGGRIWELQFGPQLDSLSWKHATHLCFELIARLQGGPWVPEKSKPPATDELRREFDAA